MEMNIDDSPSKRHFVLPFMSRKNSSGRRETSRKGRRESIKSNRLPLLGRFSDTARNHFVATISEYIGTTLFLLFSFAGTQVALLQSTPGPNVVGSPSNTSQLLYIALSFGFSLAVNAWVFFRVSGALFNPAVTLGMCLVGALPYSRGALLLVAQILGGITGAAICSAILPGPLSVGTTLGGGTSVARGLFIEMFLTTQLVITIFMLAAEKHKATFMAPIGIGLSLFIAELVGVYFTGGSVNPARSFGPAVVEHSFPSYHWIYWLGPCLGALLASAFYLLIKKLEYETANPGQDGNKEELVPFRPSSHGSAPSYAMEEGRCHHAKHHSFGGRTMDSGDNHNDYGSEKSPLDDSPGSSPLAAQPHDALGNTHHPGNQGGVVLHQDTRQTSGSPPVSNQDSIEAVLDESANASPVTNSSKPFKSAMRGGSSGVTSTPAGKEQSLSANTQQNRGSPTSQQ